MLLEQVGKGLVGQFLKCRHPVAAKLGQLVEGVVVEGDQFAQTVTSSGPSNGCEMNDPVTDSFRQEQGQGRRRCSQKGDVR